MTAPDRPSQARLDRYNSAAFASGIAVPLGLPR